MSRKEAACFIPADPTVVAVKRTIEEQADRPFALGYRITAEESIAGGPQIDDALQLISV